MSDSADPIAELVTTIWSLGCGLHGVNDRGVDGVDRVVASKSRSLAVLGMTNAGVATHVAPAVAMR